MTLIPSRSAELGRRASPVLRDRIALHITGRRALAVAMGLMLMSGAGLRLIGTNWDDGKHLHPDERYISTVADNISWPRSLGQYLDVENSPLSPYNHDEGRDYIYGTLPLFATKLGAAVFDQGSYGELNLFGRRLAAVVDTATIILVFLIAMALVDEFGRARALQAALVAAASYAFTVTAIQHGHFFTSDSWLVFFGALTFLVALRSLRLGVRREGRSPSPILLLLGASIGLTVACKISGALIAVPVGVALAARSVIAGRWAGKRRALVRLAVDAGTVVLSAYVVFRAVSPYTFAHSNWLDLSVNESFRNALENQARASSGGSLSPPSYQWLLSPRVWSPLENVAFWQLGIPLALAALVGIAALVARIAGTGFAWSRTRTSPSEDAIATMASRLMLVSFVATIFLYFGTRFAHSGRYLLPLVPFLAVAAAFGLASVSGARRRLWFALSSVLVLLTALYAVAFVHIYTQPNTRIVASEWILDHVPVGSTIANEHWDDPLPVGGRWSESVAGAREIGGYRGLLVPVFDFDDSTKLRKLYDEVSQADYYVLSSPRAWNTIGRMPNRFPLMTRFYKELFAGRLGFVRAARFTSYPQLFGVKINDLRAEEAFWVYDHPPVRIYRRTRELSWPAFRAALCQTAAAPSCS